MSFQFFSLMGSCKCETPRGLQDPSVRSSQTQQGGRSLSSGLPTKWTDQEFDCGVERRAEGKRSLACCCGGQPAGAYLGPACSLAFLTEVCVNTGREQLTAPHRSASLQPWAEPRTPSHKDNSGWPGGGGPRGGLVSAVPTQTTTTTQVQADEGSRSASRDAD